MCWSWAKVLSRIRLVNPVLTNEHLLSWDGFEAALSYHCNIKNEESNISPASISHYRLSNHSNNSICIRVWFSSPCIPQAAFDHAANQRSACPMHYVVWAHTSYVILNSGFSPVDRTSTGGKGRFFLHAQTRAWSDTDSKGWWWRTSLSSKVATDASLQACCNCRVLSNELNDHNMLLACVSLRSCNIWLRVHWTSTGECRRSTSRMTHTWCTTRSTTSYPHDCAIPRRTQELPLSTCACTSFISMNVHIPDRRSPHYVLHGCERKTLIVLARLAHWVLIHETETPPHCNLIAK